MNLSALLNLPGVGLLPSLSTRFSCGPSTWSMPMCSTLPG